MSGSVETFLEEYRKVLILAGKLGADVERLDEQRRIARSEAFIAAGDISAVKAEHVAMASEKYADAVARLDVAREKAAEAKAQATYYQARFDAWRTRSATKRTEMVIEGQR